MEQMESRRITAQELPVTSHEPRESRELYGEYIEWLRLQRPSKVEIPHDDFFDAARRIPELRVEEHPGRGPFRADTRVFIPGDRAACSFSACINDPYKAHFTPWMRPDGAVFYIPNPYGSDSYMFGPSDMRRIAWLRRILNRVPGFHFPSPVSLPARYTEMFTIAPTQRELYIICGENFGNHAREQMHAANMLPSEISRVFATQDKTGIQTHLTYLDECSREMYGYDADTSVIVLEAGSLVSKPLPQQKTNHIADIDAEEWFVHKGKVSKIILGNDFLTL